LENKTDISSYNNSWFNPGRGALIRTLWYFVNAMVFNSYAFPFNGLKVFLLRLFGAKVGKACIIKPNVNIKYPWFLKVGDYCWIGEKVWIDNLIQVEIGNNVCLSQEAFLLCGNHDYKKTTFDLIVKPIVISNGAWIGAKAIVCPGVIVKEHSVLAAASVATKNLEAYGVYQGNPAVFVKGRIIIEK
tara:strand:+ start:344 stop:904 length:561 start_codon:yes stop_codon:yes gene_type:complete